MADVTIKLNKAGVRELLRSPEVLAELRRRADLIAAAAGDGFEAEATTGPQRARASIRTGTHAARKAEATDRALTAALDAGR